MRTFFFTGFPGFLGNELIRNLLTRPDFLETKALCLIQKKFRNLAVAQSQKLIREFPTLQGRIELIEGDITLPKLGLPLDRRFDEIHQFFHLAAVYDLGVAQDIAHRINVEGTINALDFAKSLPNLERFQYVSTCYVSGKYNGPFSETSLDVGQQFNNFYEKTKFLAEVEVRKASEHGLPVTIYRPAIVVGNSKTGETQKFDGPYYVMQWLLRQPKGFAVLPSLGDSSRYTINVVPSNFVIDSIAYLSQSEKSLSKTYQLADHRPLTIKKMIEVLGQATERNVIAIPLPSAIAKFSVAKIPGVESFLKIPAATLDYFIHPTRYDCTQTQKELAEGKIEVPEFESYAPKLVQFMKQNPELRTSAMI